MKEIFHVHTYRCGHAENVSDEAYIKRALELGADKITFTDHAPFPGDPFGNRMKYNQLPEYISTLQQLKKQYMDLIEVKIGLEIEYLPSFQSYYEELASYKELDILMIGQHFYETEPGRYSFSLTDKTDEHMGCMDAIMQGLETGLFKVVAHPDRSFRRKCAWEKDCDAISMRLIKLADEKNVILEKNLSSMQRKYYFWNEFWALVPTGHKTIVGIDAHAVAELSIGDIELR